MDVATSSDRERDATGCVPTLSAPPRYIHTTCKQYISLKAGLAKAAFAHINNKKIGADFRGFVTLYHALQQAAEDVWAGQLASVVFSGHSEGSGVAIALSRIISEDNWDGLGQGTRGTPTINIQLMTTGSLPIFAEPQTVRLEVEATQIFWSEGTKRADVQALVTGELAGEKNADRFLDGWLVCDVTAGPKRALSESLAKYLVDEPAIKEDYFDQYLTTKMMAEARVDWPDHLKKLHLCQHYIIGSVVKAVSVFPKEYISLLEEDEQIPSKNKFVFKQEREVVLGGDKAGGEN